MTKTCTIQAWCVRPFISHLDPVKAETPEDAIAIARLQQATLLDAAEECNGEYPWDEFAAFDEGGNELLHILDNDARLRDAAPKLRDTLRYVALELAALKPDYLRQIGLDVALEQVEKALDFIDNPATHKSAGTAQDDQD